MSPTALVANALAEPTTGFAAMYDAYGTRIHDYCLSVLRQPDDAADATQDTFVIAYERLAQLRDPERLVPWLYSIARSRCMNRINARSRQRPVEDMEHYTIPDEIDLAATVLTADVRQLVWEAAGGLAPEDRAVLDAHLRHGLTGPDLAAALGVETAKANQMLHRMKQRMERTVGALLVIRDGRQDCSDLAVLVGDTSTLTPLLRKRVARHIDRCDVCGDRRKRLSPTALYATVPLAAPPPDLRGRILDQITAAPGSGPMDGTGAATGGPSDPAWKGNGFRDPAVARTGQRSSPRPLRVGATTVTVAAMILVALFVGRSIGGALNDPLPEIEAAGPTTSDGTSTSSGTSSTSATTTATSVTAPTTTIATSPSTTTSSNGTNETSSTTRTTAGPQSSVTLPTAPAPPNTEVFEDMTAPKLGPLMLTCTNTLVTARIQVTDAGDPSPDATLRLTNDGDLPPVDMTRSGQTNRFLAELDPTGASKIAVTFTAGGTVADRTGNTAQRSSSDSCIFVED